MKIFFNAEESTEQIQELRVSEQMGGFTSLGSRQMEIDGLVVSRELLVEKFGEPLPERVIVTFNYYSDPRGMAHFPAVLVDKGDGVVQIRKDGLAW